MMTSNRPYLLRAFYDWIIENGCTPHIVVDAMHPDANVPMQFVKDDQIVLNINPAAVGNLSINNQVVEFNARFGGSPFHVIAPMNAIMAIYARENGAGTVFQDEPEAMDEEEVESSLEVVTDSDTESVTENDTDVKESVKSEAEKPKSRSHLSVVK